jgi:hypothetical protein
MRLFAMKERVSAGRLVVARLKVAALAVEPHGSAGSLAEHAMRTAAPGTALMLRDVIPLGVSEPTLGPSISHDDFPKEVRAGNTASD